MSYVEPIRFTGRCKLLSIAIGPSTQNELLPAIRRHLPLSSAVDLPSNPSAREISAAFQSPMPKFCLLGISGAGHSGLNMIPELLRLDPKLAILAILPPNEPDLIMGCLRMGATDFLTPPFDAAHVEAAVAKLIRKLPAGGTSHLPGKIYTLMPAKGACGSTTIACALAYQCQRLGAKRVLLADLDPLTGVMAFLLKVKSQHSFVDVLQRAADMDSDLWKAMVTERHGIDVLLPPETLPDGLGELTDASPVLDYARYNYDVAVADAGTAYGHWQLSQAQLSDEVLLVTTNELPSLQAAQRVLRYLKDNGIPDWKIRLLVNRYDRHVGLSADMIADALHIDTYHVLPSDYATIQKSMLAGKPVPAASSFGKSMAELAEKLAGKSQETKKTSFEGVLSLFSRRPA